MSTNNTTQIIVNYLSIRKILKREYRYSEFDIIHTVWRLLNASDEVKEAFARWMNDGINPQLECEGITWNKLVDNRKLNPFNAFLFMDTMKKDPARGMDLLRGQMRPSMRLTPDQLRPELREYVEQQAKKAEIPQIKPDEDGNINLK